MSTYFTGSGNVGKDTPTLKTINETPVATFTAHFDHPVKNKDGEWENKGGIWAEVSVWGGRAAAVHNLVKPGCRVRVEGSMSSWKTEKGGGGINIRAESVTLDLIGIENVTFKPKKDKTADDGAESGE